MRKINNFNEKFILIAKKIYDGVRAKEKEGGYTLTDGERRQEVCNTMEWMFNELDKEHEWKIEVVYDSMMDFRKAHDI